MIIPTRRLVLAASVPALWVPATLVAEPALAVLWTALLVCAAVAGWDARLAQRMPRVALTRHVPHRVRQGDSGSLTYRLAWPGGRATAVRLLDELPADLGGDRWLGPVRLDRGARETLTLPFTAVRRGKRPLGPTHVFQTSPLGLFQRRYPVEHEQVLAVLPGAVLPGAAPSVGPGLSSRRLLRELGLRPRRPRGEGSEFESLREYTPDDEPRSIDWRASARSRNLVVRQLHVERNHTVIVAVDCGRLMGAHAGRAGARKLDQALEATVHLTRACARNGDRVGLVGFHRELASWVPPQPPRRALGPILEATLGLEPQRWDGSYRVLAEALHARQRKRALVVIMTDFVDGPSALELEAYLGPLSRRHAVLLVGLRDRALAELEHARPDLGEEELYRRLVLQDLDTAREAALLRIGRLGVHILDLDPRHITAPVLDRYLQLREAGLA